MNNKKIGIITVHRNVNYGANLQAFATCKYVNNLGYDAEIIDYYPKEIDKDNYLFSWLKLSYDCGKTKSLIHNVKLFIALALSAPQKNIRLKGFYNFRDIYCKLSPKYNRVGEIDGKYTDVICGSDQIWNPDITNGINPFYFGDILGVKNKIAYAPSLGREAYNEADETKIANLIKNMDYVSVREEKSVEYIKELSGKKVQAVCDPVFLLPKEEYENVAKPIRIKKPYVLVYSIVSNQTMVSEAKKYANEKDLTLVEICLSKNHHSKHIQLCDLSPEEFIGAIRDAETVITNSFHGTAFGIIFNKDMYVFDNKARGSRITNILGKAGLEDRIVENKIKELQPIDYNKVAKSLENYINSSKQFLISAVKSEKKIVTDNCIGCGACKSVCEFDAITLSKDYGGFIKSYTDTNRCIVCGLCRKVCPIENTPLKNENEKVYAFKAKDSIRRKSTSGGAASALAENIINNGGVVYGACLDNQFHLNHIRINHIEDISLIQGTKYIQSDMLYVFNNLKRDIENNVPVLFTGTPCQVASVHNFVTQQRLDSQNLYLCDIICHGVPSPKVFRDYIQWLSDAEKDTVKKYYFRNKAFSWRGESSAMENEASVVKRGKNISAFMNLYYSNNITNDACFSCKFTSKDRISDVTVSDFWGLEKENADFEDSLGVSMVMVNTPKGKVLFNMVDGQSMEANINNANQPQLSHPTEKPEEYDDFWKNYRKYGIDYAMKNFGIPKETIKTKIYNLLKNN